MRVVNGLVQSFVDCGWPLFVCRYDVMQRCWHLNAWRRPNFDQLVTETSNVIRTMMHSRRLSSSGSRASGLPANVSAGPADVGRRSVSAPDAGDGNVDAAAPPADYLLPTARCSDCARQDDERRRPSQPSDGDTPYVHGRQSPPPSVIYDRPTSSAAPPIELNTEQLPWRCTAV